MSGYAVPLYVIDAPGGGGKIPIMPEYVTFKNNEKINMKNYKNKQYTYYDLAYKGEQ